MPYSTIDDRHPPYVLRFAITVTYFAAVVLCREAGRRLELGEEDVTGHDE